MLATSVTLLRDKAEPAALRIGFLARSLAHFRGGVDLYVDQMLRHLAQVARAAGHRVLALFDDPSVPERFAGLPIEPDVVRLRWTTKLVWDHMVVPAWCRSRRIDVVVSPRSFRPLALPCRSVTVIYDLLYFDTRDKLPWWDHTYFRTLHRLSLHRSDAVVVFSRFTASRLAARVPRLPAARIHALPPGRPHELFFAPASEEDVGRSTLSVPPPFILVVGARPWKNVPRVIEAFARIRHDVEHSLVIASVWEQTRRELEALASDLGVTDRVLFLGRVDLHELVSLYRRAALFVYASLYEGIGMPPLESMICGCPVVASDTASIPEVTAGAAVLVNPLEVSSIADGMRQVLLNRELQEDLRRRGHQRVAELSWDDGARRLLDLMTAWA